MIISVSRRTDIPALYADWFYRRFAEGEVLVPNPVNPKQVRRVSLRREDVDGFVFWSKNPGPMTDRLDRLEEIPFYFQFTLTPYGQEIEPGLPPVCQRIETLLRLSDRIGPERVIWRYDPVFQNPDWTLDRHEEQFGERVRDFRGAVRQCTFSFLDRYRKIEGALARLGVSPWTQDTMREMAQRMARIGHAAGMTLETCAEEIDLSHLGIGPARCVDAGLLEGLACGRTGSAKPARKDPNQRAACGCAASADIGMYHTCIHGCAYCYANASAAAAGRGHAAHDPFAPMLSGI